jgi:hypothetical protein
VHQLVEDSLSFLLWVHRYCPEQVTGVAVEMHKRT